MPRGDRPAALDRADRVGADLRALLDFVRRVARADHIRDDPCGARTWVQHVPPENMAAKICQLSEDARDVLDRLESA